MVLTDLYSSPCCDRNPIVRPVEWIQIVDATHVHALTQEVLMSVYLAKNKLGSLKMVYASVFIALLGGSYPSLVIAQVSGTRPLLTRSIASEANGDSDADFIRRISKDLRGIDPTPTEVHFFVNSKDPNRRQKLIDLFIQDRLAKNRAFAYEISESQFVYRQHKETLTQVVHTVDNTAHLRQRAERKRWQLW